MGGDLLLLLRADAEKIFEEQAEQADKERKIHELDAMIMTKLIIC